MTRNVQAVSGSPPDSTLKATCVEAALRELALKREVCEIAALRREHCFANMSMSKAIQQFMDGVKVSDL